MKYLLTLFLFPITALASGYHEPDVTNNYYEENYFTTEEFYVTENITEQTYVVNKPFITEKGIAKLDRGWLRVTFAVTGALNIGSTQNYLKCFVAESDADPSVSSDGVTPGIYIDNFVMIDT